MLGILLIIESDPISMSDLEHTLISVDEAQEKILSHFTQLRDVEAVHLHDALDRVLAEDIVADFDVPPFRNSAMDGYAVRAADTASASPETPALLEVVGSVAAGATADTPLQPGQAIRIMTGAPVPPGADAVVRFERTSDAWPTKERPLDDHVAICQEAHVQDNIREAGEDLKRGDVVLSAGTQLQPADLGVLASLGYSTVPCIRQPRIAILATGDELIRPDEPLQPGKIRNSNEYVKAALVRRAGGVPVPLGIARDTVEDLTAKIREALARKVDLLVTSAGVSVGDYDMVKDVLNAKGDMHFWQVAIKPGKPLAFGTLRAEWGDVPLLGLPGNPVAAFVAFDVFARPAIRKMAGLRPLFRRRYRARLQEDVTNSGRRHYMRATAWRDPETGELRVTTKGSGVRVQGSGILSSLVWANAFVVVPENETYIPAGEQIDVELLEPVLEEAPS